MRCERAAVAEGRREDTAARAREHGLFVGQIHKDKHARWDELQMTREGHRAKRKPSTSK